MEKLLVNVLTVGILTKWPNMTTIYLETVIFLEIFHKSFATWIGFVSKKNNELC